MKQVVIFGLAALGAFALWKYVTAKSSTPAAGGAQRGDQITGILSGITGSEIHPGVPTFVGVPAINKPDQIAAFLPTNSMATIPGGGSYVPPFGPLENQTSGQELYSW